MANSSVYQYTKRTKSKKNHKALSPYLSDALPKVFLGCPCKIVTAKIPSPEERKAKRKEFDTEKRAEFLKHIAKTEQKALMAIGITPEQIKAMENGKTPLGYNTHHKVSIYAGGDNDFSNLILIKRDPYHDMIHCHIIDRQTRYMKEGDEQKISVPYPPKGVFVPRPEYKFLEKWSQNGRKTYGKKKNATLAQVEAKAKTNLNSMQARDLKYKMGVSR